MNWGTMVRAVFEDTASLMGSDSDGIKRAIVDSIRHHAAHRYWWGDDTFEAPLPEGVDVFAPGAGLPADLREIAGDALYLTNSDDIYERRRIVRVSPERMQELRASTYTEELPAYFDWWGGKLRLYPISGEQGWKLSGRYVRDVGQPVYEYTGGAWVFYTPDRLATMSDSYSSDWFRVEKCFELVKRYAVYLIYQNRLRRFDEANAVLQTWAELKATLEDEYEAKAAPASIEPWPWL